MKSIEPQFVIIRWTDAWGGATEEASLETVAERHAPITMETLGWLLRDDEVGITVFHERCTDDGTYRGRSFIPRGMVVEVSPYKLMKPRRPRVVAPVE